METVCAEPLSKLNWAMQGRLQYLPSQNDNGIPWALPRLFPTPPG